MLWYVAIGGALGSVARVSLGGVVQRSTATAFPWGTLVVNVAGCLLIGFLMRYFAEAAAASPSVRALVTAGFCGGFTTFSTFSYETIALLDQGDWRRALWYAGLSVGVSLLATVAGIALARPVALLAQGQ
ncbi:MAG: fluoride efflux transporter CrcB [Gemmatimonadota bacterium]|nr:fluoride efflux transporter CrcB [Gemmatimonadota bacterium]